MRVLALTHSHDLFQGRFLMIPNIAWKSELNSSPEDQQFQKPELVVEMLVVSSGLGFLDSLLGPSTGLEGARSTALEHSELGSKRLLKKACVKLLFEWLWLQFEGLNRKVWITSQYYKRAYFQLFQKTVRKREACIIKQPGIGGRSFAFPYPHLLALNLSL